MGEKQSKQNDEDQKQAELIHKLEQKVAISLWIQFVGQLAEAIYLSQLSALRSESEGETQNLAGQWIQTVGQAVEAVGATALTLVEEEELLIAAQRHGIHGDALQTFGSAFQVVGSRGMLIETLLSSLEVFTDI